MDRPKGRKTIKIGAGGIECRLLQVPVRVAAYSPRPVFKSIGERTQRTLMELNVCEVAKKQRHLSLLKKVKENKPLTSGELGELAKYEDKSKKKKTPVTEGTAFNTQKQAAAYAGVDVRTVRRWVAAGKLNKQYNKGKEVYYQKDIDELLKEERSEEVVKNKSKLIRAETKFKEARADMAIHQLEKDLKNYIHVSAVRSQQIKRIGVIKKALLSAARKLAPLVKGKKTIKDIAEVINTEMQRVIRDFADGYDGSSGENMD